MKKTRFIFLAILLLTFSQVSAVSYFGSDLSYTSLGSDSFRVQLVFYADCNSAGYPSSIDPLKVQGSANFSSGFELMSESDITPVCHPVLSKCAGGSYYAGIRKLVFRTVIKLGSYSGCDYLLSWKSQTQARPSPIGMHDDIYISITLNKCIPANSPQFLNDPLFFTQINNRVNYNPGVLFNSQDSVVFTMVPVYKDSGSTIGYASLSPTFPFPVEGGAAGFYLDPQYGNLNFKPDKIGFAFVMAMKATVYRGGVKAGESLRESYILFDNFGNNNNVLPATSGNVMGLIQKNICSGDSACIQFNSSDGNSNDSSFLSWDNAFAGPAFTSAHTTKNGTAQFCWKPNRNDAREKPYVFTLKNRDNSCPVRGTNIYTVVLKVSSDSATIANVTKTRLPCGGIAFTANVSSGIGPFKYNWNGADGFSGTMQNPLHYYHSNGIFSYTLKITSANSCDTFVFADTVGISDFMKAELGTYPDICRGDSISLNASVTGGTPPFTYDWNGISGGQKLTVAPLQTTSYHFLVRDKLNCISADSVLIQVNPLPNVSARNDTSVCGHSSPFTLNGMPQGGNWTGNGTSGTQFNPVSAGIGSHLLNYSYNAPNGCMQTDEVLITVKPFPIVDAGNNLDLCINSGTQLLTGYPAGGIWFGPGISGSYFDPLAIGSGAYKAYYFYSGTNGCSSADSMLVTVNQSPVADFSASVLTGNTPLTVNFSDMTGSAANKWEWNFGDASSGASNVSSLKDPVHVYSLAGTYSVSLAVTDTISGCLDLHEKNNYLSVGSNGTGKSVASVAVILFPNPADAHLYLKSCSEMQEIKIYNVLGVEVLMKLVEAAQDYVQLDIFELPAGIYIVQIGFSSSIYSGRFLKQ